MSATFRYRLAVWAWNALQTFISGLAAAVGTMLGTESVNSMLPGQIAHFTFHQILMVSVVGGVIGVVNYVRKNSLPSLDTEPGGTPLP